MCGQFLGRTLVGGYPVVQGQEESNPEGELNSWDGCAKIRVVFFKTSNQCRLSELCKGLDDADQID